MSQPLTADKGTARTQLLDALVRKGADRTYAIGYLAEHVTISTIPESGKVLIAGAGRHCGAHDPEQIDWMADLLIETSGAPMLGARPPEPASSHPPVPRAAVHRSTVAGTF